MSFLVSSSFLLRLKRRLRLSLGFPLSRKRLESIGTCSPRCKPASQNPSSKCVIQMPLTTPLSVNLEPSRFLGDNVKHPNRFCQHFFSVFLKYFIPCFFGKNPALLSLPVLLPQNRPREKKYFRQFLVVPLVPRGKAVDLHFTVRVNEQAFPQAQRHVAYLPSFAEE